MTVAELITLLREYPPDLRVVVNGYEEGYDDVVPELITPVRIALDTGTHDWEGTHKHADDARSDADTVEAVALQRTSN